MFLIRQARSDDAATLQRLARMVHSKNLPAAQDLILAKIRRSRRSFSGEVTDRTQREFMFVLEDTESGNVTGTSSIIAALGGPSRPHLYFQVHKREHYSHDLQTGQVHVTLQMAADESGPTEIGGLILSPSYRGHKQHLGSLLSLIRFHYIGLHRDWFADRIIAEMMGPLTPDSRNTLWEYLGRRFINLSYEEADRFSRDSKEFVLSLYPRGEIYVSLLPPEARSLIGRVGAEAEPALGMLKQLGFQYRNHIDPFDGGPYLDARIDEIPLIGQTRSFPLVEAEDELRDRAFVSVDDSRGFRATRSAFALVGDGIALPPETTRLLGIAAGAVIGVTPRNVAPTDTAGQPAGELEAGQPG